MPIEFNPLAPWLCFALALLAVPLAVLVRRLGAATRRSPLPPGWSISHAGLAGLTGLMVLIAILVAGPVLEGATVTLLRGAGMGRDLGEPATWTAAAAALQVWLALQAWRLLLLGWPLLYALTRVASVRWTARLALGLALLAALPLAGALVVMAFPARTPADALAAGLLLWTLPLHLWLGARLATHARRGFSAWRHAPLDEPTRVSPMPAALAASLQVGEGPTTGFVRVRRE